jgi:hypothetical protein
MMDKATSESSILSKGMASHETDVTEKVYLIGRNKVKNIEINIITA